MVNCNKWQAYISYIKLYKAISEICLFDISIWINISGIFKFLSRSSHFPMQHDAEHATLTKNTSTSLLTTAGLLLYWKKPAYTTRNLGYTFSSLCEQTTWCVCPVSLSNSSDTQSNSASWTQKKDFVRPAPHARFGEVTHSSEQCSIIGRETDGLHYLFRL